MSCRVLRRGARPAPMFHRLLCRECRSAYRADRIIALGIACLRAEPGPIDGLSRALRAVGLNPRSNVEARLRVMRIVRRLRRVFCAFVAPVFAAGWGWTWWIDRDPNVVVPSPVMPAVNAYTSFVEAGLSLKDGTRIECAVTNKPPRQTSAAPPTMGARVLVGAAGTMGAATGTTTPPLGPPPVSSIGGNHAAVAVVRPAPMATANSYYAPVAKTVDWSKHLFTTGEKAALVAENAQALRLLREGFRHPYMEPPARSFAALFPHYQNYKGLAHLLQLEAQVKNEGGDHAGAIASCLDAIQLGRHMPHGGAVLAKMTGLACEASGRAEAWRTIDALSAHEALEASRRLGKIREEYVPQSKAVEEEKWLGIAGLEQIMRQRNWRMMSGPLLTGTSDGPNGGSLLWYAVLLPYSKSEILRNYSDAMDRSIQIAQQPYEFQRDTAYPEPTDPINRVMFPVYAQAAFRDFCNETENALLQVALALRAYVAETGYYPRTLSDLTPRYLASVPADPFAIGKGLFYRPTEKAYVLYSMGPDGNDDRGTPICGNGPIDDKSRYNVKADSRGDIVAGVNLQ